MPLLRGNTEPLADKGDEAGFIESVAKRDLVLDHGGVSQQPFEVEVIVARGLVDDHRELIDQQGRGLSPEDAATGAGEVDPESEIDGVVVDEAGGSIENGLAAGVDLELLVRPRGGSEGAGQVVPGRAAADVVGQRGLGDPASLERDEGPQPRWGGVGISLNVLDHQIEAVERKAPALDLLVGFVAAPVDAMQDGLEVIHLHVPHRRVLSFEL